MAGWRPEPGDTITGRVKALSLSMPGRWGSYPILTLDNGTDIHAFHSTLKRDLSLLRPVIGDTITITYHGKVEGNEYIYHNYDVEVAGKSPDVWGALGTSVQSAPMQSDVPTSRDPGDDDIPF